MSFVGKQIKSAERVADFFDPPTLVITALVGVVLLISGSINWSVINQSPNTQPASIRSYMIASVIIGVLLIALAILVGIVTLYSSKGRKLEQGVKAVEQVEVDVGQIQKAAGTPATVTTWLDPKSNKRYFFNPTTRKTEWVK